MKVAFSTRGSTAASRYSTTVQSVPNIVPRRLIAPDVTASSGRKAAGTTPSSQPLRAQRLTACQASGTGATVLAAPDMPHDTMAEGGTDTSTVKLIKLLKPLAADHSDAVKILLSWGDDLADCLRDYDAVELYSQLAQIKGHVLGPDHPGTLDGRRYLAYAKWDSGEPESPETLLDLVSAHVRVLGPDHPDARSCMLCLAESYEHEGQWLKAKDVLTQALEMSTRAFGADHKDTKYVASQLQQLPERQQEQEQDRDRHGG